MKKLKLGFFLISLPLFLLPLLASGAGLVPCGGEDEPPCQLCHFFVLFKNVLDFIYFKIIPPLAVLFIAIGGFMYVFAFLDPQEMFGGGQPSLINKAKKLFASVMIGLILVYGSWIIVNTFFMIIGVAEWTGLKQGWWHINCP